MKENTIKFLEEIMKRMAKEIGDEWTQIFIELNKLERLREKVESKALNKKVIDGKNTDEILEHLKIARKLLEEE